MPNRLILEVGVGSVEVAFKGTAAQIRAAVRRYAESQGMDVAGKTDAQAGEMVLRSFMRQVKAASMAKQRTTAYADLAASIEAQLLADNDIYDEPAP